MTRDAIALGYCNGIEDEVGSLMESGIDAVEEALENPEARKRGKVVISSDGPDEVPVHVSADSDIDGIAVVHDDADDDMAELGKLSSKTVSESEG